MSSTCIFRISIYTPFINHRTQCMQSEGTLECIHWKISKIKQLNNCYILLNTKNTNGSCLITISNRTDRLLFSNFFRKRTQGPTYISTHQTYWITEHRHKKILHGFLHMICTMNHVNKIYTAMYINIK